MINHGNSSGDYKRQKIAAYQDTIHAEVLDDLCVGEHGYKYRILDGLVLPPYVTPERYRLSRTIETRPGDICYVSFPKSGSTWLAHIIVLITRNGVSPEQGTLRSHLNWMESSWTYPRSRAELEALPSPRIFKSHMPFSMALGGDPLANPCRYVYIARNPKDVAVSYYYFEKGKAWSGHYSGSWNHWLSMFTEGRVQRGDWFEHVTSWWKNADAENILYLKYEDLVRDFAGQLKKLSRFLGKDLSAEVRENIEHKTSFANMKGDPFSNMHEIEDFEGFFREGRIGSWKKQFTKAQSNAMDQLIQERLGDTRLEFDFD